MSMFSGDRMGASVVSYAGFFQLRVTLFLLKFEVTSRLSTLLGVAFEVFVTDILFKETIPLGVAVAMLNPMYAVVVSAAVRRITLSAEPLFRSIVSVTSVLVMPSAAGAVPHFTLSTSLSNAPACDTLYLIR